MYVMINCRKVQSKTKLKENYLKIPLKEIITSPKKYSSMIIVNDIKMDFSISLSKNTELNITSTEKNNENIKKEISPAKPAIRKFDKKESKNEIMKEKSSEIYKHNMKNINTMKEKEKEKEGNNLNNSNKNIRFTYRKPLYIGKNSNKTVLNKSFDKGDYNKIQMKKKLSLSNKINYNKPRFTEYQNHSFDAKIKKNLDKKEKVKENSEEIFNINKKVKEKREE